MSIERSKAGTKEKISLDGINHPDQNTILINIVWYYIYKTWKNTMKFNSQKKKNELKYSKNDKL